MEHTNNEKAYQIAKERVAEIKKYYNEVVSSIFTIMLVAGINYYFNQWRYPWFLWVVLGLTISLLVKALKLFDLNPFMSKDWEKRKIQEFMKTQQKQERWN